MENTIEITVETKEKEVVEMLIAELSVVGFEGFQELEGKLLAYTAESKMDENLTSLVISKYHLEYSKRMIPGQNWNQSWESNFQPVMVDDFVGIRADFHPAIEGVQYQIQITPKMSFGTGHHATTYLMIGQMRSLELKGSSVLDFGTGTGVLAILAEKLGAEKIVAIDNDEWSIKNAEENIQKNGCSRIEVRFENSLEKMDEKFDIVLANINRNILLDNLPAIASHTHNGSAILLSGILAQDGEEMTNAAEAHSLKLSERTEKNGWICLKLNR